VRPYTTKTNKPMGFVTLEDLQGNIELVLFPRVWEKNRDLLTVGQIVIVEGKVDASTQPPKILVDNVRTEIKLLEPLKDTAPHTPPTPDPDHEAFSSPKPDSHVTPLHIQSRQPQPIATLQKKPLAQIAEAPAAYVPPAPAAPSGWDDDMPPPPENFPDGWETQWQPSFDEAAIAARPQPRFDKKEPVTPPRPLVETLPAGLVDGETEQAEAEHEAIVTSLKSFYLPLAKPEDKDHPIRQITVNLRSSGNKEADRRQIKAIYGTLISFHGRDRFSFQIFENGSRHLIDFPNDTTRICAELLTRLKKLLGGEHWSVEDILFQ
jgi:DNA polymerase-3 subunit alpha